MVLEDNDLQDGTAEDPSRRWTRSKSSFSGQKKVMLHM